MLLKFLRIKNRLNRFQNLSNIQKVKGYKKMKLEEFYIYQK